MSNLTPKIQCQNSFHGFLLLRGNLFHDEKTHLKFFCVMSSPMRFIKHFSSRTTSSSTTQKSSPDETEKILFKAFDLPFASSFLIKQIFTSLNLFSFIKFSTTRIVLSVQWSAQIITSFFMGLLISCRFLIRDSKVLDIVNSPLWVGIAIVRDFMSVRLL